MSSTYVLVPVESEPVRQARSDSEYRGRQVPDRSRTAEARNRSVERRQVRQTYAANGGRF